MSTNELSISFVPASTVLAAAIVLPCVGIFSVGVRFLVRWKNQRSIGADDWLILGALVRSTVSISSLLYSTRFELQTK